MKYRVQAAFICFGSVEVEAESAAAAEAAVEKKRDFEHREVSKDPHAPLRVDSVLEGETECAE